MHGKSTSLVKNCADITAYLNISSVLPDKADVAIIFGTQLADPVDMALAPGVIFIPVQSIKKPSASNCINRGPE